MENVAAAEAFAAPRRNDLYIKMIPGATNELKLFMKELLKYVQMTFFPGSLYF